MNLVDMDVLVDGARLYTFNFKHFRAVPGLDVAHPSSRL